MKSFIISYGLPVLVIGMLLEGELLFIAGIIIAKTGSLSLVGVLISVFLGALAHDWLFYTMGKMQGVFFFQKRPKLQKKLDTVLVPFDKNPWLFLLSYRFLIGFRMIMAALFGLSGISISSFFIASLLSNLVWVGFYGVMGYYFADAVLANLEWINQHILWVIGIPIAVIISYNFPKLFVRHPVE